MYGKLLLLSVATSIVGCKQTVTCSDENTQQLVKDTFYQQFDAKYLGDKNLAELFSKPLKDYATLSLDVIQTTQSNKDTGKQSCSADFKVAFHNIESFNLTSNTFSGEITYETQMSDDGKYQTMKVQGFDSSDHIVVQTKAALGTIIQAQAATQLAPGEVEVVGNINGGNSMAGTPPMMDTCDMNKSCELDSDGQITKSSDGYILQDDATNYSFDCMQGHLCKFAVKLKKGSGDYSSQDVIYEMRVLQVIK